MAGEVVLTSFLTLFSVALARLGHGSWPSALALTPPLAVAVLTPLRRVLPSAVLVIAAGLSGHFALPLLPVAAWSAARRVESPRRISAVFAASFVAFSLCLVGVGTLVRADALSLGLWAASSSLAFLFFAGLPALVGRYRVQRRRLLQALRERNEQLLRERAWVAEQSRVRERQRIAQDMHDSLGHQLTLIAVHAGALELDRSLVGDARTAVGVVRDAAVNAMRELRTVVGVLSDAEGDGIEQSGPRGVGGIDGLVAVCAAGTRARIERSGEPRPLTVAADACAYRLVQEGLTNAYKHAPGAAILVELRWEPDAVVVAVANEPPRPGGGGTALVSGGNGLIGLRERARLAGGMVHSGPSADGGFRLAAVLPYPRDGRGDEATSVVAADDFGEQPALRGPGDVGADSSQAGTDGKPGRKMENKTAKRIAWGCGGSVVVFMMIVAVAIFGIRKVVHETHRSSIDTSTYDSITVGQDEKSVRSGLPSGNGSLVRGFGGDIPADPPGDKCVHYLSRPVFAAHVKVYRFCFKGGKLVEKSVLAARN